MTAAARPMRVHIVGVADGSVRRVLAVKPGGPWLVIVDGAWNAESARAGTDTPFERSRTGLLPLLERLRDEVETQAGQALRSGDPELGEALRAVVGCVPKPVSMRVFQRNAGDPVGAAPSERPALYKQARIAFPT
jgi:hypothetical protein